MELVKARCTSCGGELDVNPEAECLVCKYCGTPFIVSKAINNYNTTVNNNVVNNICADNVIVGGFDEKAELEKARKLLEKDKDLAQKAYQRIFENNPDNWEAQYLRIYLLDPRKQEKPAFATIEQVKARNILFEKVIAEGDDDAVEALKKLFDLKYFSRPYELNRLSGSDTPPRKDIIAYLHGKEQAVKFLNEKIRDNADVYKKDPSNRDSYFMARYFEDIMLAIEPQYQPIDLKEPPEIVYKKRGCYVATCVYGSYDCPQVWVLRRFRDYKLNKTWHGRAFIRIYYAVSPTLVKWFGNTKWFKKMWRSKLNAMVEKYKDQGFEDTPYCDLY